jgi:tetratricopeptide (TPR) repeat protein
MNNRNEAWRHAVHRAVHRPRRRFAARWLPFLLAAAGPAHALCGGPLDNNNFRRPIDINDPADHREIYLVVKHHFTPEVAALIRGSTAKLPGDIHYTLRHIPNHYGALESMARYQLQNPGFSDHYFTVDCYFERAFAFRPKDSRLYLLYGTYLHRIRRYDEAGRAYAHAEELGLESPELYYNRGLLEFERDNLDEAAAYAAKAYAGGYPLPALRDKLDKAGVPIPGS